MTGDSLAFQKLDFVLNAGPAVRRTYRGRQYLVADATIMPPGGGVMAGSKGPLFYPLEEQVKNVGDWDDLPATLYHPFDPLTGDNLSAQAPGVIDRQGLGFLRRDRLENSDGVIKRRVKVWFDTEKTKAKSPATYNKLLAGEPIELSTGLYTDNLPSPGTWNGKRFDYVAINYRPDHLAILPDQRGACSREDGCGIFNADGSVAEELFAAGKKLAASKDPAPMPGYGQIFFKGDQAWYVGGDGDERGFNEVVQKVLKAVPTIKKVTGGAEQFPPQDQGWIQAYPKNKPHVSNASGLRKESANCLEGNAGDESNESTQIRKRREALQGEGWDQGLVDNPAVSEDQRRFLNWSKGHDWVKAHGFDNKGPLPESISNDSQIVNRLREILNGDDCKDDKT